MTTQYGSSNNLVIDSFRASGYSCHDLNIACTTDLWSSLPAITSFFLFLPSNTP
ncbi:hypothetical protein [Desulfosediminicola ganghwensis]|uniref:hypothetical protein n=1 Tax=Desulfosediminicola ganghwensis TaxID=2569540 RepID=UPI0012947070|nr:hypothetical protein [Desulfosediminicola ganghwensis]